ncbi:MAG: DUF488 family protein, partial [Planctomycetaceae bacterium]
MSHTIWTIGHSNRGAAEFLGLLTGEEIELLVDVRRFPGSRTHPQFNADALQQSLADAGIKYRHMEALGGRRSARRPDSPNTAWRVESFNAYADHMLTPEFQAALEQLEDRAKRERTVITCAEAVPWRCHRRLIADALTARGWTVRNLMSAGRVAPHTLTPFARVENGRVTY